MLVHSVTRENTELLGQPQVISQAQSNRHTKAQSGRKMEPDRWLPRVDGKNRLKTRSCFWVMNENILNGFHDNCTTLTKLEMTNYPFLDGQAAGYADGISVRVQRTTPGSYRDEGILQFITTDRFQS